MECRKTRHLAYSRGKKRNPPETFSSISNENVNEPNFNLWHFLWTYLRKSKRMETQISSINAPSVIKSVETYLPPINAKVTDYQTTQRYIHHLQNLAEKVNMPFVNITVDVGAAMNAYLITWNAPEIFSRIVIHLRSFHFLKEIFQVSFDFSSFLLASHFCYSNLFYAYVHGRYFPGRGTNIKLPLLD